MPAPPPLFAGEPHERAVTPAAERGGDLPRMPAWLRSWGVAALLVTVAYPGLVVFNGSLANSNITPIAGASTVGSTVPGVWPTFAVAAPGQQWGDVGAGLWQHEAAYRKLADGFALPWWDPTLAAGMPTREILSDGSTSPVALLSAILGGTPAAFTFATLALVLAACAALVHVLTQERGTSVWAAAGGVAVFLLGGFGTAYLNNQVGQPYFLAAPALLALIRAVNRRTIASGCVAALAVAAMVLAGFPSTVLTCGAAIALLVLAWTPGQARRAAVTLVATTAAAAAMTAFFWLPALAHLARAGLESFVGRAAPSRHLADLLAIASPVHAWSTKDAATMPAHVAEIFVPAHALGYLGVLAFGLVAFVRARDQLGWTALGITVGSLLIHLQVQPFVSVLELPGLAAVRPVYWSAPAAIAGAVLIATAIDQLRRAHLLLLAAWAAGFALLAHLVRIATGTQWTRAAAFATALLVLLAAVLGGLAASKRMSLRFAVPVVASLLIIELVAYAPHLFHRRLDVEERIPLAMRTLQTRAESERVRIINAGRQLLYPNWAGVLGMEQIDTLSTPQLPWTRAFYDANVDGNDAPHELFLEIAGHSDDYSRAPHINRSALDAAGVTHAVISDEFERIQESFSYLPVAGTGTACQPWDGNCQRGFTIYENEQAWPVAYLAGAPTEHDFETAPRPRFSQARPLSDDSRLLEAAGELPSSMPGGTVRVLRRDPEHVVVEVDAEAEALLAMTDAWHPGWRATINEDPAYVGRVNQMFRAVVVPEGRSVVEMHYRPVEVVAGRWISASALLILTSLMAASVVRRLLRSRPRETETG